MARKKKSNPLLASIGNPPPRVGDLVRVRREFDDGTVTVSKKLARVVRVGPGGWGHQVARIVWEDGSDGGELLLNEIVPADHKENPPPYGPRSARCMVCGRPGGKLCSAACAAEVREGRHRRSACAYCGRPSATYACDRAACAEAYAEQVHRKHGEGTQENPKRGRKPRAVARLTAHEVRSAPGYEEARKRYKKFHGHEPEHATVVRVDDGKPGVTRKCVVALGEVPETHYVVPWKKSNKKDTHWVHKHPERGMPLEVLDPQTELTFKIPGPRTKVTDWWHG